MFITPIKEWLETHSMMEPKQRFALWVIGNSVALNVQSEEIEDIWPAANPETDSDNMIGAQLERIYERDGEAAYDVFLKRFIEIRNKIMAARNENGDELLGGEEEYGR